MFRTVLSVATLLSVANHASAQNEQQLLRLIEREFAVPTEDHIHEFLGVATQRGLVNGRAQSTVAKQVFRTYLEKNAEAIAARANALQPGCAGGGVSSMVGGDDECNDTVGFAETLTLSAGNNLTVNGVVGGAGDLRDVYRLVLVGGAPEHQLVITATPVAPSINPPATLNLSDADGRFILNGSPFIITGPPVVITRKINRISLPDGTYYVTLLGTGAYQLAISSTATTIPSLTNLATGGFTLTPEVQTYRLMVASPGETVHIEIKNTAASDAGDYFFNLGRQKGGRVLFMDDTIVPPAPTPQTAPLVDAELPAGTYYLFVQEFFSATVNANYTVFYSSTPIASIPSAIGVNNYTMVHGGNYFVYSLNLSATDHFRFVVTRPVTGGDSFYELFDAQMGQVLYGDDSASGLAGGTLYSYMDNTLPAGQYWLLARSFSTTSITNFGQWTETGTAGLPVTLNAVGAIRQEPIALPLGGHYAFHYTACCDSPLSATHTNTLSLVGADGLLRGYYGHLAASSPGSATVVGTRMLANETVFGNLQTTNYAATTTASFYLAGKLGIDLSPVSPTGVYSLKSEDKIGNLQFLFTTTGSMPGQMIPGFSGLLCLDVVNSLTFYVGSNAFSASCRFTWPLPDLRPFLPPASMPGIRLQALSLDGTLTGGFTNIAQ